ncbi:MAG: SCO family protein [Pikeienuella sp.]
MTGTGRYAMAAAAVTAIGLGAGAWFALSGGDEGIYADCSDSVATTGATLGGPFELVSETGATVTEADVITRPTFVYFGYTFCPDVCPVDAANMAQAATLLAEQGSPANTIFVTIDPARDTPEVMAEFTDALHPDMLGLTGSDEQINAAAKEFRVYFAKAESDDPEYYLMDHSANIYLMGPGNEFLDFFRRGMTPDQMAEKAACYVRAFEANT